jgi:hypothetical protein
MGKYYLIGERHVDDGSFFMLEKPEYIQDTINILQTQFRAFLEIQRIKPNAYFVEGDLEVFFPGHFAKGHRKLLEEVCTSVGTEFKTLLDKKGYDEQKNIDSNMYQYLRERHWLRDITERNTAIVHTGYWHTPRLEKKLLDKGHEVEVLFCWKGEDYAPTPEFIEYLEFVHRRMAQRAETEDLGKMIKYLKEKMGLTGF